VNIYLFYFISREVGKVNTLSKTIAVAAATGTFLSLIGAGEAFAISLTNTRPVTIQSTNKLQNTLNNINSGITNVNNAAFQSNVALWDINSPLTNKPTSSIILELAAFAGKNVFGIYDPKDPTKLSQIFEGEDKPKESAIIEFIPNGSFYDIKVTEGDSVSPDSDSYYNKALSSSLFGFYITSPQGTFYTQDDLNNDGYKPHAVVFGGTGKTLTLPGYELLGDKVFDKNKDFIFAWEDLAAGGDKDNNDMVLLVQDIGAAVPEPLTMLGAGAAAGFGAFFKRQTSKKQEKDS
jgi:hypothetical protein